MLCRALSRMVFAQHDFEKTHARRTAPGIVRPHEELRHPREVRSGNRSSLRQRAVSESEKLSRPIRIGFDPWSDGAHLLKHLGLAHPIPEPVQLEIERHVWVQVVIANGKGERILDNHRCPLLRGWCVAQPRGGLPRCRRTREAGGSGHSRDYLSSGLAGQGAWVALLR